MLDQFNALLIDIGNTRIKYVLVNDASQLDNIQYCQRVDELGSAIQQASQVLVSCVGHDDLSNKIAELCRQADRPCQIVKTQAETLGIRCAYQTYQTLGVDRWLAILAARVITSLPVAVIDLGTANTCDIVIGNKHEGGWISPGHSLMRESLLQNTENVFANSHTPKVLTLGNNTPDCVNLGCLASQMGFVNMAEQYLSMAHTEYLILISGGGQEMVHLANSGKVKFYPNLVLRGLFRLI